MNITILWTYNHGRNILNKGKRNQEKLDRSTKV